MTIALSVTAKGQITLKQAVLEHLGVRPGERVRVTLLPEGRIELRPAGTSTPISRLRGVLRRDGQAAVSIEEMQRAIEEGAGGL